MAMPIPAVPPALERLAHWCKVGLMIFGVLAAANGLLALIGPAPIVRVGEKVEKIVAAREPGVAYSVLGFCEDQDTRVAYGASMEAPGRHFVLTRGQELISWKDTDPPGSNPNAMRYWITPAGQQQAEPVEITRAAERCIRAKVGK